MRMDSRFHSDPQPFVRDLRGNPMKLGVWICATHRFADCFATSAIHTDAILAYTGHTHGFVDCSTLSAPPSNAQLANKGGEYKTAPRIDSPTGSSSAP